MADKNKIITGRRKTSVARIIVKTGSGRLCVNGLDYKDYFKRKAVAADVVKPLEVTASLNKFDISVNVRGGGLSGQAGAVRWAIAKAIREENPKVKTLLRKNGYLTRDDRKVERKMYGHKKSRKSFQFSKR